MAISRMYLEPFKWTYLEVDMAKLGKGNELLSKCLNSDAFWTGLSKSHSILKKKYPCGDKTSADLQTEIEHL